VRSIVVLLLWLLIVGIVLAAADSDARQVIESYVPGFALLGPVIDWLSAFLADLWHAITN